MDRAKLEKNLKARGIDFRYFETGEEAAEYLCAELDGVTVGIGGSKTVEAIELYEKLQGRARVFWHWKQEPDEARARAAEAEVYVASANGMAETGEIVNIDGMGNRLAGTFYGHKRVYIVAGVNKVMPDLDSAIFRARNVAAPKNARRFGKKTPCATGELKCYDCQSPERICRNMDIIMGKSMGMDNLEVVLINKELGY